MKQNIVKRSGEAERFQPDKIANSMRNAGVSETTAQEVSGAIAFREGMGTPEIRRRVVSGIKNREPLAAKRYESYPKKTHKT